MARIAVFGYASTFFRHPIVRALGRSKPSEFFKILLHGPIYIGKAHPGLDDIGPDKDDQPSDKTVRAISERFTCSRLPHRNLAQGYNYFRLNDFNLTLGANTRSKFAMRCYVAAGYFADDI